MLVVVFCCFFGVLAPHVMVPLPPPKGSAAGSYFALHVVYKSITTADWSLVSSYVWAHGLVSYLLE